MVWIPSEKKSALWQAERAVSVPDFCKTIKKILSTQMQAPKEDQNTINPNAGQKYLQPKIGPEDETNLPEFRPGENTHTGQEKTNIQLTQIQSQRRPDHVKHSFI